MPKIFIISNRLPVTIDKKAGELLYHPSAGGLASGLTSLDNEISKVWIGWPGEVITGEKDRKTITAKFEKDGLIPVFLSKKEVELYYEGFSNKTIWPLFHYFTQYTSYNEDYWKAYNAVNQKFAKEACKHLKNDDFVWIQDYQLMLLPSLIRQKFPDISIGFFLHIPFPSYEIFRILPWREEILHGMLGADQIGFHTFNYMRHFLSSVYRITGNEHNFGKITINNRVLNVDVFPMGIDYEKYAHGKISKKTIRELLPPRSRKKEKKLIVSIDRLDYTKGIPQRLKAFERFLKENKSYHELVTLILIVVPSRSNVDQYQELKSRIETIVGRINGQYRTFNWEPIQYYYRALPFDQLMALYKTAHIALITPLRDGMNLVAKEFVACKQDKKGVLILSEMAGAANELTEALLINPQDEEDIVNALKLAINMPVSEQKERLELMQKRLKKYNVSHWAKSFIREQIKVAKLQGKRKVELLKPEERNTLIKKYRGAKKRLLLLDYDGTLMDFQSDPSKVVPDTDLIMLLSKLNRDRKNKMVIVSGRGHIKLEKWLNKTKADLSAEHGVWNKRNGRWKVVNGLSFDWKKQVEPVLEKLVERTPGSFIEEKDYSLVWHYRNVDKELGEKRVREFHDELLYYAANHDLQVLEGNKVIEIKNAGVNKGTAALGWLNNNAWDFILTIGDDYTDEDMFRVMPGNAYTIKVGPKQSLAGYNVLSVKHVRELLQELSRK